MKEERVFFGKDRVRLEGLFAVAGGTKGAVISHPHSLMGGDMWNPVVETVAQALFDAGISTLRFNFRGVGGSGGHFDEGRGEQADLLSAFAFLEDRGIKEVLPAGYSFGAWVTAGVLGRRTLAPALFVAPPIEMFSFDSGDPAEPRGTHRLRGPRSVLPGGRGSAHGNGAILPAGVHPGCGSFLHVARNGSCRPYRRLCTQWGDMIGEQSGLGFLRRSVSAPGRWLSTL